MLTTVASLLHVSLTNSYDDDIMNNTQINKSNIAA